MQPYRMELSEFKITQNDPIHPLVLKLMLDNLQYRYDNPKLKDNNWNFKNEKYDIDFHRITNDNGKYVAIYCWKAPTELPLILAMVKVYLNLLEIKTFHYITIKKINNLKCELERIFVT